MDVPLPGFSAVPYHSAWLSQAQFTALRGLFIALQMAFDAAEYAYARCDSYGLVAERCGGERATTIAVHFSVNASGQHRLSALIAAAELDFFALAGALGLDMAVIGELERAARTGAAILDGMSG